MVTALQVGLLESTRSALESLQPYLWHSSKHMIFRDFFSRGEPENEINKSGLDPVCATNRPAELVVHDDKSQLHHDPVLSPHHSQTCLSLPWQGRVLVAFSLHQLCPWLATWNAPSQGQGIPEICGLSSHACHPWSNAQGTLLSLPSYCSSYLCFTVLQSP